MESLTIFNIFGNFAYDKFFRQVTWADIAYYAHFSFLLEKHPEILKDSPHLKSLLAKIESHPSIKKYLENRPITEY